MKLSTVPVLLAVIGVWWGFSVASALMITFIQHRIDDPIITFGGILIFFVSLTYLAVRAKPVFNYITKISELLKLFKPT